MSDVADEESAALEREKSAALRDILAGAGLVALGLLVGGSALDGRADGMDYAFDALGIAWIAFGGARLLARRG